MTTNTEALKLARDTLTTAMYYSGPWAEIFAKFKATVASIDEALAAAPVAAPDPAALVAAGPSPTTGMTIPQRILHVGGRNNAAGYVEFGSTQAVEALVRQVLRDLPPTVAAEPAPAVPAPNPGSPEASAMIDSLLKEYEYPANPTNAARAGYMAAVRLLSGVAQPLAPAPAAPSAAELKRLKELSNIIHDLIVGQQAAWIEWQHGKGAEAAMSWIHNGLVGPGHIPDESEPYGKEAQAWYDANQSEPFPTCFCGRPSNTGWMSQGFCSEAHYKQRREELAATPTAGAKP